MIRSLLLSATVLTFAGNMMSATPAMAAAKHARSAEESNPADPVVARVNSDIIHRSDVENVLKQILPAGQKVGPSDLEKIYPGIISDLITHKLAYQQGMREGLANKPDVRKAIESDRQQIISQAYFNEVGEPAATDDKLRQAYDQVTKGMAGQEELHARVIVAKTEDEAKDIIKQLDSGTDFEKLAKEKSEDKATGAQGGDIGYFLKSGREPALSEAAFALSPNTYTKTPVKGTGGYYVIQALDKRPAKVPTFDEAKAQLRNQVATIAIKQKLGELARNQHIEVYNLDGSPMKAAPQGAPAEQKPASPAAAPAAAPAGQNGLQLPQTTSQP